MLSPTNLPRASQVHSLPASFAFRGGGNVVAGTGAPQLVTPGQAETLEQRVAEALAGTGDQGILGGALPFDKSRDDYLWLYPETCQHGLQRGSVPMSPRADIQPAPLASDFFQSVAAALRIMEAETGATDALRKIVLARTLAVSADQPIDPNALMARMSQDPSVMAYQVSLPPKPDQSLPRRLVGASPELLLGKSGSQITSYPLAGSARRHTDPILDADAAAQLVRSDKDRREHDMVVEYILDTLAPFCRSISAPDGTGLTSTRSMWHLGTRIEGDLIDPGVPSVVLASRLHPTPAVCGVPPQRAACLIRDLEPVDRDFYAGAVGWCDRNGDGAWYVAIRCAELCGNEARLFAGAGIVPGSDPTAETAETGAKFAAMLGALGLPADAGLVSLPKP